MTTRIPAAAAAPAHPVPSPLRLAFPAGVAGLELAPFLGIVCAFWCYATLSAVLYAYGLDASFSREIGKSLFASWQPRVVQYLLLLPPLIACYWWSLRIGWQPLWPRLAPQVALGIGFALLARPALWAGLTLLGEGEGESHEPWMGLLGWLGPELPSWLASLTDFLVRYGFGLALVTGFAIYKQYRDLEIQRAALERQWSAARLAALRMQLSPHTLFNLLHTIRGQIAWDPPAAQAMVVRLADLLRRLLTAGERDFSPLGDELEFVRLYLELQRARFTDRLTVSIPAADGLPAAWVPSLILQPLVENAVTHGLAGHDGPVHVEVGARLEGDDLILRVTNGIDPTAGRGRHGIGLRNVSERLAVQFGDRARLTAGRQVPGAWVAEISLPLLLEIALAPDTGE